ncbi:heparan-alpha-glucosaminide N-acetyltransferase domain-containing protein [Hymenobacter tibetensis]|uniref:Heparan-alpha-glucosaminide N-acetyltransferase domain-containing protein n=1 Tax=Hymenobacter tibetensis TaxID=497967 RepID=A0ABY4CTY7_9BACT|nr:heparan-alpha-glucosaminide N-acetyltransferase domain-containing protein [Hymenobacter tibetensis]UOG73729.1 heparan-alpha-glucosaminide N-acetyltransferase domain-containing protein [Hymenobacter tibetensis]
MTTRTSQAALETTHAQPLVEASQPGRLVSLDVFRGITVAAMILVNNPGDWGHIYVPLEHAAWHGCTPTDLIFPFFLFIVGVSIVYALDGARRQPETHGRTMVRILKRSAILFGLGLFSALFPNFDFETVRIPGVLARISWVFLVCGVLFLKTTRRQQLGLLAFVLVLYNVLLQVVPVPGFGPANLEASTNLGAWLDRVVFTEKHLWSSSRTWDPEGLLGTLPAVGTGLLGMLTGQWLRRKDVDPATRVAWLFVAGAGAVVLGLIWNGWFPINKALWTSSFVLYAGGLAMATLAGLYWLTDVQGYRRFTTPALVYGVNAITVFFLSAIVAKSLNLIKVTAASVPLKTWLYTTFFTPYFSPINASLAGALVCVLIWLGILWIMYRKGVIIKV